MYITFCKVYLAGYRTIQGVSPKNIYVSARLVYIQTVMEMLVVSSGMCLPMGQIRAYRLRLFQSKTFECLSNNSGLADGKHKLKVSRLCFVTVSFFLYPNG